MYHFVLIPKPECFILIHHSRSFVGLPQESQQFSHSKAIKIHVHCQVNLMSKYFDIQFVEISS